MNINKIKKEKTFAIYNVGDRPFDEELMEGIFEFSQKFFFPPTNAVINDYWIDKIPNKEKISDEELINGFNYLDIKINFSKEIYKKEILLYIEENK